MRLVVRHETVNIEILNTYPKCQRKFQNFGWLPFLQKFQGNDKQLMKACAESFSCMQAQIGDLQLQLLEAFIAQATRFPQSKERWFQNQKVKRELWKEFLKDHVKVENWNKGMPTLVFKKKWRDILFILQKYVTCEGRYGLVFYYHLRLLMHFIKGNEIDMPFYLLNSLKKMALTIQRISRSLERSLFHFGLVKILVEARLQEQNDN
jgi:hypothetical protein